MTFEQWWAHWMGEDIADNDSTHKDCAKAAWKAAHEVGRGEGYDAGYYDANSDENC